MAQIVTPEKLAYWYFRLNGFMVVENFILHPESPNGSQRTDADLYGVRFPFSEELGMPDDDLFQKQPNKPFFVIAEIKRGECKLNGPWKEPDLQNVQYVLRRIGALENSLVDYIAKSLYEKHLFEDEKIRIQLLLIGSRKNEEYVTKYPELHQIFFAEMLSFMHKRFDGFRKHKRNNQQWDSAGQFLYKESIRSADDFILRVLEQAGVQSVQTGA